MMEQTLQLYLLSEKSSHERNYGYIVCHPSSLLGENSSLLIPDINQTIKMSNINVKK